MHNKQDIELLKKFLPEASVHSVAELMNSLNFQLIIAKSRKSILGNYMPPIKHNYHRISVNYNLHKIEFLIVLLHEIAHLKNWNRYKQSIKPHGKEWKQEFRKLLNLFIINQDYDKEIRETVYQFYFEQDIISSNQCKKLKSILYGNENKKIDIVEDVPNGSYFILEATKKKYLKIKKLRKLYLCKEHDSGKLYRVYSGAQIVRIK